MITAWILAILTGLTLEFYFHVPGKEVILGAAISFIVTMLIHIYIFTKKLIE